MSISILVEPAANGFRAATGGPLDLQAEASTQADAVSALRAKIAGRLRVAVLIEQPLAPPSPFLTMPLHENPLFDDWLAAVDEYRNRADADERAQSPDAE